MKHGYSSEYDRVKRSADIQHATKHRKFGDVDANDPDLDDATRDRVAKAHAEYRAEIERLNAAERKRREEAEANATARTLRSSKLIMLREWQALGVKPPMVDAEGWPTVSLSWMLIMGWEIREGEHGEKMLVKPPPPPKRKTQEEWAREREEEAANELKKTL